MFANRTTAMARIKGGPLAPDITGVVRFREVYGGTWISVEVSGLPDYVPGDPPHWASWFPYS